MKTRDMEWAEFHLGGPLEETLPILFEELHSVEAVASHIGINRVTLYRWLKELGAEREKVIQTRVRFPDYSSPG